MSKRIKRTKLSTTLPREVVLQIAQFLPDKASFFAYIEAFQGTSSDEGPLEALWNLGRAIQHWKLWPNLRLYPMRADEWGLAIQVIPVYARVDMNARYHLHRLVDHVNPSTNLVVIHDDKPDPRRMRKWFGQVAQLPVRGLVYVTRAYADRMPAVIPHLVNVWPSLTHLRRLDLSVGDQASLESICKCIATSQITELCLNGYNSIEANEAPHINVEGEEVWANLVAWLRSTSVIRFELHKFWFIRDDDASMQALNSALAASDSMQRIIWCQCAIRISAPLVLPPRLQEVSFMRSAFEQVGIDWMWQLLPTLPHITHVNAVGIPLSPSDVDGLASVLAQSTISSLQLDYCSLGVGGHYAACIQRLADAVETSASLRTLCLTNNRLGFDGVRAILAAIERRPYVTETVTLERNNFKNRRDELQDLVNTCMPPRVKINI